jgi:hypothetical protein
MKGLIYGRIRLHSRTTAHDVCATYNERRCFLPQQQYKVRIYMPNRPSDQMLQVETSATTGKVTESASWMRWWRLVKGALRLADISECDTMRTIQII